MTIHEQPNHESVFYQIQRILEFHPHQQWKDLEHHSFQLADKSKSEFGHYTKDQLRASVYPTIPVLKTISPKTDVE